MHACTAANLHPGQSIHRLGALVKTQAAVLHPFLQLGISAIPGLVAGVG